MKLLSIAIATAAAFSTYAAAGSCSGGVSVCCGSASVGCSGDICKACCGNNCGCFYKKGSECSSDSDEVPCVDINQPDFALTNGECVAPDSNDGDGDGEASSESSSSASASSNGLSGFQNLFNSLFGGGL
ncbi:hypothetical protein KC318_g5145 [Hortaea werneckii]|uniref:Uncharacterized protein n=1 Tax=Hortaea werneckii TaxID=91943 RepID=A0A3M7ADD1_HORWE|nr:hypothetical protein KC334_g6237 [Hortaea werneckii]KAI7005726.1 hypothetical protein KC355_g8085 [Hortaea werneckii]KAI7668666.1 hypothetical protein KC318_g5145 [Hortaea werneckii]RMY25535.1 hypothetical protein D0867_00672 [Hortaea werneckii]RMY41883.1 hypothetical protein D0866_00308 [Hortaea werneckii]